MHPAVKRTHELLLLLCMLGLQACAQQPAAKEPSLLAPNAIDGIALLPPPPAPGTHEDAIDVAAVKQAQLTRTPEEETAARAEVELFIDDFQPAIGPWFVESRLPKTWAFFRQVMRESKDITARPKEFWKRPRPYLTDSSIKPFKPEKSYAYPSGHAAGGTEYAILLAELIPEHKAEILRTGQGIGWHRVVAGVHHPSDVLAGRVLGQRVAQQLLASPAVQLKLMELRAEIAAARGQAASP